MQRMSFVTRRTGGRNRCAARCGRSVRARRPCSQPTLKRRSIPSLSRCWVMAGFLTSDLVLWRALAKVENLQEALRARSTCRADAKRKCPRMGAMRPAQGTCPVDLDDDDDLAAASSSVSGRRRCFQSLPPLQLLPSVKQTLLLATPSSRASLGDEPAPAPSAVIGSAVGRRR